MTDTTHEAPERIWLTNFVKDGYGARLGRGTISDLDHSPNPDYPEYVRADLVQAAVAAALRDAADALYKWGDIYGDNAARCVLALIPKGEE